MIEVSKLVEDIAARHSGLLISILEDIQERYNYLPEETIVEVAKSLDIPLRDCIWSCNLLSLLIDRLF